MRKRVRTASVSASRRRWQVATVAMGLAVLATGVGEAFDVQGAAVGAVHGDEPNGAAPDDGGNGAVPTGMVSVPQVDAEQTRRHAVDYLVSHGVPAEQARTRIAAQSAQVRAATRLRRQEPDSIQSVWIADNGTLKATVTDEKGARAARDAGATPVTAPLAAADLEAVRDRLATDTLNNPPPNFNGASFAIDDTTGKVIAEYLFTGSPTVPDAVTDLGDQVTATAELGAIEFQEEVAVAGATMKTRIDARTKRTCTAAWAVDIEDPNGGEPANGVMTAGHCFNSGESADTTFTIDTTAADDTKATGDFHTLGVAGDYAYLRLEKDRGSTSLAVIPRVIEAIEEPVIGAVICQYGAKSHETCGKILRLNVTKIIPHRGVNFLLKGQTRADNCSQHGDSGAPVYMDYDQARGPLGIAGLGIHSTGRTSSRTGKCTASFTPLANIDNQGKYHIRIDGG